MRLFYLLCLAISPLFLTADTIVVKTKAPQNRNAVFQYRVPRGYDKNRQRQFFTFLFVLNQKETGPNGVAPLGPNYLFFSSKKLGASSIPELFLIQYGKRIGGKITVLSRRIYYLHPHILKTPKHQKDHRRKPWNKRWYNYWR